MFRVLNLYENVCGVWRTECDHKIEREPTGIKNSCENESDIWHVECYHKINCEQMGTEIKGETNKYE